MQKLPFNIPKLNRTQQLWAGLATVAVLYFGSGLVSSYLLEPFRSRIKLRDDLTAKVEQKQETDLAILRARKELKDFQARSLPPDRGALTAKTPTAIDAQRYYQEWITDLAQLSSWESVVVKPSSRKAVNAGTKPVAIGVQVNVAAEARFEQLLTFLDHFYRTDLLHRITSLHVESRESEGDPLLKITLTAEGLAMVDVPWRSSLFPQTTITADCDSEGTVVEVAKTEAFPKQAPFRVRIGNEFLTVTKMDATRWTVERGIERSGAQSHVTGATVELVRLSKSRPSLEFDQFRELLKSNPFIKPPPPIEYKLKLGPLGEQPFVRGQPFKFTIPISGYDPTLGRPEFFVKGKLPPAMQIDRQSGVVTWTPPDNQPAGKYPLALEIRHPSAAEGPLKADLTVVLREPNTTPQGTVAAVPTAYIGQLWSYKLDLKDGETAVEKLVVKPADGSPPGIMFNPIKRALEWTPPEGQALGELKLNITVTDDGTPPQSATISVPVNVQEDAASLTYLVGVIAENDVRTAWLYDRSQDRKTVLKVGDQVSVADVSGKVSDIFKDYVVIEQSDKKSRLDLGDHLRQLRPMPPTPQ